MLQHEIQRRVTYAQTDKMGYLYYGNYPEYYEVGRVEFLRHYGMTYKSLEDEMQIMLPVVSLQVKYIRPAYYDDMITVRTMLKSFTEKDIVFLTELYNEAGKLMNVGEVRLAFVSMTTMKRCAPPDQLCDIIARAEAAQGDAA